MAGPRITPILNTYIVRPGRWYAPKWHDWYRSHPVYWNNFHRSYPYWRNHRMATIMTRISMSATTMARAAVGITARMGTDKQTT